jgi:hypothetical protein
MSGRTDLLAHALDDVVHELAPGVDVAAVLVGAPVGVGGEEVRDQVAHDAGYLHHVEPSFDAATGGVDVLLDGELHLFVAHLVDGLEETQALRQIGGTFAEGRFHAANASAVHQLG